MRKIIKGFALIVMEVSRSFVFVQRGLSDCGESVLNTELSNKQYKDTHNIEDSLDNFLKLAKIMMLACYTPCSKWEGLCL